MKDGDWVMLGVLVKLETDKAYGNYFASIWQGSETGQEVISRVPLDLDQI